MNLYICIFEDQPESLHHLKQTIRDWCVRHAYTAHFSTYADEASVDESLVIQTDIFFFDIELDGGSGLHAAQKVRMLSQTVPIVFLTNHQKYVFDGYVVQAFRYLMKPITPRDCASCLEEAAAFSRSKWKQNLVVLQKGRSWLLPIPQVLYIEAAGHACRIRTERESITCRKGFHELRQELPPHSFIQTHRSYLVNYRHIHTLAERSLGLDNGEQVPLSRSYRAGVIQFLADYLGGKP